MVAGLCGADGLRVQRSAVSANIREPVAVPLPCPPMVETDVGVHHMNRMVVLTSSALVRKQLVMFGSKPYLT